MSTKISVLLLVHVDLFRIVYHAVWQQEYCKNVRFCGVHMKFIRFVFHKRRFHVCSLDKKNSLKNIVFDLKNLLFFHNCTFFLCFTTLWKCIILCSVQNGQYSNGTHCIDCPAGTYCPDPTLGSVVCSNGQYQPSTAQTSCIQCPSGQSCLDKTATPVDCNPGYFSLAGEETCTVSCFLMLFIVNILYKCRVFLDWVKRLLKKLRL